MGENILIYGVIGIEIIAVFLQLTLCIHFTNLKNASKKMQLTSNGTLKQMKLKYENCIKLNVYIPDMDIFIKRYMDSEKVMGIPVTYIENVNCLLKVTVFVLGTVQVTFDIHKGLIVLFLLYAVKAVMSLFDYRKQLQEVSVNIRECLGRVNRSLTNEAHMDEIQEMRLRDSNSENTKLSVSNLKENDVGEKKSSDNSLEEAAISEILAEFFNM